MIYSIDATSSTCLARFVNDSPSKFCNCKMVLHVYNGEPNLCLVALKDILPEEELRYDYGEKNKKLFWRQQVRIITLLFLYQLN